MEFHVPYLTFDHHQFCGKLRSESDVGQPKTIEIAMIWTGTEGLSLLVPAGDGFILSQLLPSLNTCTTFFALRIKTRE